MEVARRVRSAGSPFPDVIGHSDFRALIKTPPFQTGTCEIYGRSIAFSNVDGLVHSVREIFVDDVYKFQPATTSPHIIDAGANIGLSVVYFKREHPDCTIVAFEPDPSIFELLKLNVGGYDGVELRPAAAWIDDTELTFYSEGSLAGSTEIDFNNKNRKTVVKAVRLKTELQKKPVDLLKMDIEGAENSVLFDIEAELANIRLLFFEYHSVPGKPQQLGDMLALVTKAGFRYVINSPHGPRLPFVDTVSSGFDLQLNVFCFRN